MTAEHTRLVTALRELRSRTGLSLAALSARTAYSKSSWERYLNGRGLPPRAAVRDLCRIAAEPDERLLALWEIAESQWSGRGTVDAPAGPPPSPAPTPTPAPEPEPPAGRPPGRRRRLMTALASAYVLLAAGVAVALLLLPDRDPADAGPRPAAAPHSTVPPCHGTTCEGQDPLRLVCGIGPATLATHRTATGAHVELRYSAKCGAGWARTWGTAIGDRLELTGTGPTHRVRIADQEDADTYVYTGMAAARPGSTVRACFRPAAAGGEPECVTARVAPPRSPSAP
ncbi:DUF2690 domain-containing protein [Streptomyces sp. JW3]|uniref:helix-turn-helix domain-containing protein n=1 Tax=Streptomyces sp. JW3 TaxID=3456955 RepID=UPI003FA46844